MDFKTEHDCPMPLAATMHASQVLTSKPAVLGQHTTVSVPPWKHVYVDAFTCLGISALRILIGYCAHNRNRTRGSLMSQTALVCICTKHLYSTNADAVALTYCSFGAVVYGNIPEFHFLG